MRKEHLIAFFPKITPKRYRSLIAVWGSVIPAWQADATALRQVGWDIDAANDFVAWRNSICEQKLEETLTAEGIQVVGIEDAEYPKLLKELYDPPVALFVRGQLPIDAVCVAVVGTRKFSPYGRQVTEELVGGLARSSVTIVSGLALGIDGFAHEATLANNGKTIAVLGSGPDRAHVFPAMHRSLADRIVAAGGAVISEYPPGTESTTFTFPRRNRIIAGLSLATLVIEAPESSGSLITATCALENNRDVFAVPQNITAPNAAGPNTLIKQGAKPVTCVEDILETLHIEKQKQFQAAAAVIADSPVEAKILAALSREPIHIDFLTKAVNLPSPVVGSTLTLMEIKGKVRNLGGMMYVTTR